MVFIRVLSPLVLLALATGSAGCADPNEWCDGWMEQRDTEYALEGSIEIDWESGGAPTLPASQHISLWARDRFSADDGVSVYGCVVDEEGVSWAATLAIYEGLDQFLPASYVYDPEVDRNEFSFSLYRCEDCEAGEVPERLAATEPDRVAGEAVVEDYAERGLFQGHGSVAADGSVSRTSVVTFEWDMFRFIGRI